jgi:sugar lactone lactonase YvrE
MATAEDHLFVLSVGGGTQRVHIFSKNGTLKTSVNMA